ncbi:uroporphyrinogen decarboxylase, putative [Eimeria tenella]|uniref:Uroporphyrinogen decarboxylase n=1 Tax=Eimeria tenella TaxID=5802 RepID=U6KPI7_EIMTE|nr:uroporphyrinogen decarboxylase, putative [Eimeria tenella]CDJ39891.1 uroporphyrinogen decarboxylase, putative [Eimeria tenella]|eukprot:XP_013230644.1 uroporphyrinogen decarboxylase, putative [Eimeria tenella]
MRLLLLAAVCVYTALEQQPSLAFVVRGIAGSLSVSGPSWRAGTGCCSCSSNSSNSNSNNAISYISRRLDSFVMSRRSSLSAVSPVAEAAVASSPVAPEIPQETPEEVKQQIRKRRLSNHLPPHRILKNDCLRVALMGPSEYRELILQQGIAAATAVTARVQTEEPAAAATAEAGDIDTFAVPVWVMRQAGRYLPEFRAVCRDPLLAAEVTLQPLRRFPQLDAVIIFTDILVLPEAMGMPLTVEEGEGPRFGWRLESPSDIDRLDATFDVEDKLGHVLDAIYATVEQLDGRVPLIGFSGAPLTLFCYMVEGGSSAKGWRRCKEFIYQHQEKSLLLLQQIAAAAARYLIKQVDAGAQVLQVFDTNAGAFSPEEYERFGAPFMRQIAEEVASARPGVPLIAFPKDQPLSSFNSSSFSAISIGWGTERALAKARLQQGASLGTRPPIDSPLTKALQGNLDPHILYAPDEVIRQQTTDMVRAFQPGRYVANLGHGMEPQMDPHKLEVFLQSVKDAAAQIKEEHEAACNTQAARQPAT